MNLKLPFDAQKLIFFMVCFLCLILRNLFLLWNDKNILCLAYRNLFFTFKAVIHLELSFVYVRSRDPGFSSFEIDISYEMGPHFLLNSTYFDL